MYDLDDIEDSSSDGVLDRNDYENSVWKYNQDVDIILTGLTEETQYSHIYCYAEDDEDDGMGGTPNRMLYDNTGTSVQPSQVAYVRTEIGSVTTLDESPPSFTHLWVRDPTEYNNKIVVQLKLNEPGTAYCRVARVDSGETSTDMPINRILSANWSGEFTQHMHNNWHLNLKTTIEITQLENVDHSLTVRDDDVSPIIEAIQYDVYCWSQDNAVTTAGLPRVNYMIQD